MIFDTSKTGQLERAISYINDLAELSKKVEIKEYRTKRTNLQNRALHLYFENLSKSLNNDGCIWNSPLGFDMPFTPELIKYTFWTPHAKMLYNIDSTTQLTTEMINNLYDIFNLYFSSKFGLHINFPSWQSFFDENESFLEHYSNLI